MADIPATVIEVDAADTVTARRVLLEEPAVLSIAQLGTRLHVLIDRGIEDAETRIAAILGGANVEAHATRVAPSLEDVFVSATGFSRAQHASTDG